ncbi:MAG: DUF2975 domain-containing protein [Enterococcus sp.]
MKIKNLIIRGFLVVSMLVLALFIGLTIIQFTTAEDPHFPISMSIFAVALVLDLLALEFIVLQMNNLLTLINQNLVFSTDSLKPVRQIKQTFFAMGIVTFGMLPFIFQGAQADDAPGLILFGLGVAFIPFALSVFVSLLEQLLQQIIAIKSENELTI